MNTRYPHAKNLFRSAIIGLALVTTAASIQQGSCSVVGYVNTPLRKGLTLIVNPLKTTNDVADTVMLSSPEGTSFYRFDSATQTYKDAATFFGGFGWCPVSGSKSDPALILNPGEGFWVESPQAWTNTFVGEVLQGSLTNPIPAYYSLKGSMVPQSGKLETDLKFPARQSDSVWKWLGLAFDPYHYDSVLLWNPAEPTLGVGEGFILWRDPALATQANWWVRNFTPILAQSAVQSPGSSPPTANSSPPTLKIHSIAMRSGSLTLEVQNSAGIPYDVQFSRDGRSWVTVASKAKGNVWKTPFPGGAQGFYQLSNP